MTTLHATLSRLTRIALVLALALGLTVAVDAPATSPLSAAEAFAAPPKRKPKRTRRRAKPKKTPEAKAKDDAPAEPTPEPTLQRSNRMELDARLVRGESARSGAVYLFQRAPRRLPPLVDLHQSWLDEITVPVLGRGAHREAATAAAPARAEDAAP